MNSFVETTPECEFGATLPLTEEVTRQSFVNEDGIAASIISSMARLPPPQAMTTSSQVPMKRTAVEATSGPVGPHVSIASDAPAKYLTTAEKRRGVEDGSTLYRRTIGPFDVGHLKATLYFWVGFESKGENRAEIVLTAPASTIEAVKQVADKKAWSLQYRLSTSYWKDGKVCVKCCIEIPPEFMDKFSEILSIVKRLSEASQLGSKEEQLSI